MSLYKDKFWIDDLVTLTSKFLYVNLDSEKAFNSVSQLILVIFFILWII